MQALKRKLNAMKVELSDITKQYLKMDPTIVIGHNDLGRHIDLSYAGNIRSKLLQADIAHSGWHIVQHKGMHIITLEELTGLSAEKGNYTLGECILYASKRVFQELSRGRPFTSHDLFRRSGSNNNTSANSPFRA